MAVSMDARPAGNDGGFAGRFSIEATRPSEAEIAAVAAIAPGREFFLSAVPRESFEEQASFAAAARRAGLEPVAHLPARRIRDRAELDDILKRLNGEAGARKLLIIAGDKDEASAFPDALALIKSGALAKAGITGIGITGYPEGHPKIPEGALEQAMRDKITEAAAQNLKLSIVSQFAFDPAAIVAWVKRLRAAEIIAPVQVGMAGPTSVTSLLRYAKRCGVNTSFRGLFSGASGLLGHAALGQATPDNILEALGAAQAELGDTHPHYFSFGGVVETARYAHAAAIAAGAGQKQTARAVTRAV
jgi:methylenetetrahydrofolate reductase (NADPH)